MCKSISSDGKSYSHNEMNTNWSSMWFPHIRVHIMMTNVDHLILFAEHKTVMKNVRFELKPCWTIEQLLANFMQSLAWIFLVKSNRTICLIEYLYMSVVFVVCAFEIHWFALRVFRPVPLYTHIDRGNINSTSIFDGMIHRRCETCARQNEMVKYNQCRNLIESNRTESNWNGYINVCECASARACVFIKCDKSRVKTTKLKIKTTNINGNLSLYPYWMSVCAHAALRSAHTPNANAYTQICTMYMYTMSMEKSCARAL